MIKRFICFLMGHNIDQYSIRERFDYLFNMQSEDEDPDVAWKEGWCTKCKRYVEIKTNEKA